MMRVGRPFLWGLTSGVVLIVSAAAVAQVSPSIEVSFELGKRDFCDSVRSAPDLVFCLFESETASTALFCDILPPSEVVFEKVKSERGGPAQALYGASWPDPAY